MIEVGTKVVLTYEARNYTYEDFDWKDKVLKVTYISRNKNDHPGYDESMEGMPLYDLETLNGESVNCSLYEYEVERY